MLCEENKLKNYFVLFSLILYCSICLTPRLTSAGTDQINFLQDKLYIEKAKQQIIKKHPTLKIKDLELINDQSGSTEGNIKYINGMKYFKGYFFFRLRSSIKSEKNNDLTIYHFNGYEIGILENGEFLQNEERINAFPVSSCTANTPTTDGGLDISWYQADAKDICCILCSWKEKEFEGYFGQNVKIAGKSNAFVKMLFPRIKQLPL